MSKAVIHAEPAFCCAEQLLAMAPAYARLTAEASAAMFPSRPEYRKGQPDGRVGVVELVGEMTKAYSWQVRQQVNALADNNQVSEVLVLVDSPGGQVSGVHDLHMAIARAAERKRVTAFIEDMGASGAYYAIAGASEIVMNPAGLCGSIGVFMVVVDASRHFKDRGIEFLTIASGKLKGGREWGERISQEQIDQLQKRVDSQAALFVAAVAKGRRMTAAKVNEIADGRVWVGAQAVAAGLVDRIAVFEDVLAAAIERSPGERWQHLYGAEAAAKFDELLRAQGGADRCGGVPDWRRKIVAEAYPELAARAAEHKGKKT
jgi:protease-4